MILEGEYGKYNKKIGEVLVKVDSANRRLSDLAEGLLNVSKMEAGGLSYDFSQGNLEELLVELDDIFSVMAKERRISLDFVFPEEKTPQLKMDRAKLREAVSGLVDNAIRYTKQGGVTVRLSSKENRILVEVSDTGIGIKKEDLPKLFAKFSRGQGVSRIHTEGVGLGLYVARQIVEMHGGRILAESEGEGQGSIFTIELPLKA
jgi:signal transduction histidine kinase